MSVTTYFGKRGLYVLVFLVLLILALIPLGRSPEKALTGYHSQNRARKEVITMEIKSSNFENGEMIPPQFTCDGEDKSPILTVGNVPEGAKSLTLIVDDPDAPGGTFTHWVVFNLPPQTKVVRADDLPQEAVESVTSFGKQGWGGPCPPSGVHRYYFKIYALDKTLDLPSSASKQEVESAMADHILDSAELMGRYGRQK